MKREIRFRKPLYIDGEFFSFQRWGYDEYFDEFQSPSIPMGTEAKPDEQFTGIQDEKGMDIYEGDIVEVGSGIGEETCTIVYSREECGFLMVNLEGLSFGFMDYTLQVVGNIHENPELLKEAAENPQIE